MPDRAIIPELCACFDLSVHYHQKNTRPNICAWPIDLISYILREFRPLCQTFTHVISAKPHTVGILALELGELGVDNFQDGLGRYEMVG